MQLIHVGHMRSRIIEEACVRQPVVDNQNINISKEAPGQILAAF